MGFDGEGFACEKRLLVEKGKLNTLLLNLSAAKQLKMNLPQSQAKMVDDAAEIFKRRANCMSKCSTPT